VKWRCTWCGKPHAENDPPCDNCGHNVFEEAVVRQEPEGTSSSGTVDTGTTYVWRCQNCGRDHVKNNPPCARCGNHDLEKTEQTFDDIERDLETPGWLEVAKPYTPILVVFGVVVALFATGIISPSMIPGIGSPSPPDAPGEGTEAAGIDFELTEREVYDRLEAEREVSRSYDDDLAAFAEYYNRAIVAIEYDDAEPESVEPGDFGADCGSEVTIQPGSTPLSIDEYDDETELADDVADSLVTSAETGVTDPDYGSEGIDLHVVDGTVYLVYAAC